MKARFSIVFVVDFERDNYCYKINSLNYGNNKHQY